MRRIAFALLILSLTGITLGAEETVRNIATVEVLTNFDETWDIKAEDVFLLPLHPNILLELRATGNFTDRFSRFMFQPGGVFVFAPGLYLELVYGPAVNDSGEWSQEGFFELTWEQPRYIVAGGVKFGYFHADNSWFVIPSLYGMAFIIDQWAMRLKYLASINSYDEVTHGFILENRVYWTKAVETDLVTSASFLVEPSAWFTYEVGARVVFNITNDVTLKYYIGLVGSEEEPTGILNILTLDVKFAGKKNQPVPADLDDPAAE